MKKRILMALLALSCLLSACNRQTGNLSSGGSQSPASSSGEAAADQTAAILIPTLPDIPDPPDENAMWDELSKLDMEDEETYNTRYDALWNEYESQQTAYQTAVNDLRGDGAGDLSNLEPYALQSIAQILLSGEENQNTIYSPANLYLALAMLSETTAGTSRQQILDLLGADSVEALRTQSNAVWRNLYEVTASGKTVMANSYWLDNEVDYNQDVLQTLSDSYYASSHQVDMGTAEANQALGAWLDANTGGLLTEQANAVETDPLTLLALASTLYFKDNWADEFEESLTEEDTFTAADGTEQTVDFMHQTISGNFVRTDKYQMAERAFQGNAAMKIVLPMEGVTPEEILSDTDTLRTILKTDWREDAAFGDIVWSMPKFDVTSSLELKDAMIDLGISDVFDIDSADFSPLTDIDAYLSSVQHAARVKVDENGCEAAAFTVMMVEAGEAPPDDLQTCVMDLDRPFLFIITGLDNLPLFVGTVNTME